MSDFVGIFLPGFVTGLLCVILIVAAILERQRD